MKQNSFEKQFPGYKIVPEKKKHWQWALIWAGFTVMVVVIPLLLFKLLSLTTPTPNMAGNNKFTLSTVRALALQQSAQEKHSEALASFQRYFSMGGQEADIMAMYAYTLMELGRDEEAREWSRKASAQDPESKAARMIRDALEKK